ncbi:MAG: MBL fold metallo-hydrolase [Candidatus Thorarchaeota archaeon]
MDIDKKIIPKVSNKTLREMLEQGVKDAQTALAGKTIPDDEGHFGESRQLLPFQILKASGVEVEGLEKARAVDVALERVLRGITRGLSENDFVKAAILLTYGMILESYNKEDFRHVYRLSLISGFSRHTIEEWLRKAIVIVSLAENYEGRSLLDRFREWIEFLGTPLWLPEKFKEPCEEFGVDITEILQEEDYRFVATLRKYSNYLDEALGDRTYEAVRRLTREWLPDGISQKLHGIYQKKVNTEAQKHITQNMSVTEAIDTVQKFYDEVGFKSHEGTILPVRLQDLPEPPPIEAMDPVIFEMIPQKLRVGLMSSVAYSTKIKQIEIIFLGGPRIGHSGILIKTDTGGVLLDYGLSVANQRIPWWEPELEMIDTVLISHAHLDHVGGLPILYDKFEGKWCSTGLTAAVSRLLLEDALNVGTPLPPRKRDRTDLVSRYNRRNIDRAIRNHVELEIEKSSEVAPGIVVTPLEASHIPGSAAYLFDIEGVQILYTGDFNLDQSLILPGASLPTNPDYVIFDGTYWGREDFNRTQVLHQMEEIIKNHGPVIIPTFAVGRSQEMLTLLEQIGATQSKNVIVAGLAEKVTKISGYEGHWHALKSGQTKLQEDDILVAGGGMMNGGLAKEHFEQQRDNPNAAIVLCGYLAPRTPGWNLLHGFEDHQCRVQYARLSAHSSASQLQAYVKECTGKRIMVHTPTEQEPRGIKIPRPSERIIIKT